MKKSVLTNLILLVVLGGLVAWYFIYEKKMKVTHQEAEDKTKQLVTLGKDEIHEVTIQRSQGAGTFSTIRLKKAGSDWSLTEPIADMADASTVTSMVSALATGKQERVVEEDPKDLEQYGLKEPRIKVTVQKDGTTPAQEVHFGKNTPIGSFVYARVASQKPVYKMAQHIATNFEKDAKALRNKNVFQLGRTDVGEIEISSSAGNVVLKRDDKDQWILPREHMPADNTEASKTLNALIDLRATDFASEDGKNPAEFGMTPPAAKIFITKAKDTTRYALWLGKGKGDKTFAKREDRPTVFEIEKDAFQTLIRPGTAYRNMELASFSRFDVKRIKIERPKESVELLKETAGWTFPTDPKFKTDDAKVENYLSKIQDTRIAKYATADKKGTLKDPQLTLRLFEKKDAGEVEKVTLKFGKPQKEGVWVERTGLDLPFFIKEEDFKKLTAGKPEFEKIDPPKVDNKTGNVIPEPDKKS